MKIDFKTSMLLLTFGLPLLLLAFIGLLYFGNCGFNNNCSQAALAPVIHTPIPTLIPAAMPTAALGAGPAERSRCTVNAQTLLAAWVGGGYSETGPFEFTDQRGTLCTAAFADVQPLFSEVNLWYSGALACVSCHNSNLATAAVQMDLSSYAGILAGSQRTSPDVRGTDILGGGNWAAAKLNEMLFVKQLMPFGRPAGAVPPGGPTLLAGTPKVTP
jgi:hypothetical protein